MGFVQDRHSNKCFLFWWSGSQYNNMGPDLLGIFGHECGRNSLLERCIWCELAMTCSQSWLVIHKILTYIYTNLYVSYKQSTPRRFNSLTTPKLTHRDRLRQVYWSITFTASQNITSRNQGTPGACKALAPAALLLALSAVHCSYSQQIFYTSQHRQDRWGID